MGLGMKTCPAAGTQEPGLFPNKGMQVISDPPRKCIPQGESPSSHSWQFPLWLLARPPAFETPWDFAWVSVLLILPRRNPRLFWTSSLFARTDARATLLLHVSTGGTAKPVYFQKARGALLSPQRLQSDAHHCACQILGCFLGLNPEQSRSKSNHLSR